MITSERLSKAMAIAVKAHTGQVRKGTLTPYIAHPIAVCALALEYGADEEQACAALLHDALEDGGAQYAEVIRTELSERVLSIVQGCTDGVPDANGQKADWKPRKEAYLAHLKEASDDVLLVSGSDKLHNARAIVSDLQRIGTAVFSRFSAPMADTLWYYSSLANIFSERGALMAGALRQEVDRMHQISQPPVVSQSQ